MSLSRLANALAKGEVSPSQVVEAYLNALERHQDLNIYLSVRAEGAMAEAKALEKTGPAGALWGIPIGIKDIIDVTDAPTTAASKILASNVATTDATVVARLKTAGAIILGKVNTHEFAYGAMTNSPHFGPARNPWDPTRICGGSSGGSGAVVAAGLAAGALGTDTSGSVRVPASLCGVSGVRPTTGRVSNHGVIPVAWSFDTVGPLASTAEDCALLLNATAGHDPRDPSTVDVPVPDYHAALVGDVRGLRIGIVRTLLERDVDPRIAAAVTEAIEILVSLGAEVHDVDIDHFDAFGPIQQSMQFPEATTVHMDNLRHHIEDIGPDVRARLLVGLFLSPTAYVTGQRARRVANGAIDRVLKDVDVLAAPTMPIVAPPIGEDLVEVDGKKMSYRLSFIRFQSCWSVVGLPVVSVPCALVEGLPAGLSLIGRRFDEATLLRAAHAFQQVTDWHERTPEGLPRVPLSGI